VISRSGGLRLCAIMVGTRCAVLYPMTFATPERATTSKLLHHNRPGADVLMVIAKRSGPEGWSGASDG